MPKNEAKVPPGKVTPAPALTDPEKGCATSFLTREKGEMDKVCGEVAPKPKEEYIQPDDEKESGGES